MRHRAVPSSVTDSTSTTRARSFTKIDGDAGPLAVASPGHDDTDTRPVVPRQIQRDDERPIEPAPTPGAPATQPDESAPEATDQVAPAGGAALDPSAIPQRARWRASHLPRSLAATMLLAACLGTTTLAGRYAEAHSADSAIALAVGVGVIVGLWALLIASTPQVVLLSGSILTIRSSRGVETFDLADGLQPVDIVDEPGSAKWALLLHRTDGSSMVLRRRDVDAAALDPIVRHYRAIAALSMEDRRARFQR